MAAQRFDEAGERGQRGAQLVAGVGQEVGAHLLHPARVGFVAHVEQAAAQALRPGRQRPGPGAPEAVLHAARLIGGRALDAVEQGLVHRFQHLGIAHGGDQDGAVALDAQELARGRVGEDHPVAHDVVALGGGDEQDGVRQGLERRLEVEHAGDVLRRGTGLGRAGPGRPVAQARKDAGERGGQGGQREGTAWRRGAHRREQQEQAHAHPAAEHDSPRARRGGARGGGGGLVQRHGMRGLRKAAF